MSSPSAISATPFGLLLLGDVSVPHGVQTYTFLNLSITPPVFLASLFGKSPVEVGVTAGLLPQTLANRVDLSTLSHSPAGGDLSTLTMAMRVDKCCPSLSGGLSDGLDCAFGWAYQHSDRCGHRYNRFHCLRWNFAFLDSPVPR